MESDFGVTFFASVSFRNVNNILGREALIAHHGMVD